ncbi:MAG: hypothetical protein IPM51_10575 [Sphingobacteriaceae bacterium]|nr:hypothetical protein [Sphingobacteriaceae bacterium]
MTKQEEKEIADLIGRYVQLRDEDLAYVEDDNVEKLELIAKNNERKLLEISKAPFVRFPIWAQVLTWLFIVFCLVAARL